MRKNPELSQPHSIKQKLLARLYFHTELHRVMHKNKTVAVNVNEQLCNWQMTFMNFPSVYQPKTLHWDFLFFSDFSEEYFLSTLSLRVSFITIIVCWEGHYAELPNCTLH